MKKDIMIGVKVDEETKKKLDQIAENNGRTLSNLVRYIINQYLKVER